MLSIGNFYIFQALMSRINYILEYYVVISRGKMLTSF